MKLKNGMVIRCNSEEEAKEFIKEAYKQGFKWFLTINGNKEKTYWDTGYSEIYYHLEDNRITWSPKDFDNDSIEYSTLKEKMKTMTKSDLKNGMVVEFRDESRGLVHNERIISMEDYLLISKLNDDLTNKIGIEEIDIMKIFHSKPITLGDLFADNRLELIWERKEQPKLSEKDKKKIVKGFKAAQKYCKKQTECRECEMRISGGCMIGFDITGSDLDKLFED